MLFFKSCYILDDLLKSIVPLMSNSFLVYNEVKKLMSNISKRIQSGKKIELKCLILI